MRILIIAGLGLAAGCTTPDPEPKLAQPSCLEYAELTPLNASAVEERDAKAEIDLQTKTALGFAVEGADQPDSHRLPRVLRPPVPYYPTRAMKCGIQGDCEILFDVDKSGNPINIVPVCTNALLNRAAASAVARAEFSPATIDGIPVEYPGVVYPMSFSLSQ